MPPVLRTMAELAVQTLPIALGGPRLRVSGPHGSSRA